MSTPEEQVSEPKQEAAVVEAPAEVDFDRILAGDEAYTKTVNEQLTTQEVAPDPEKPAEEVKAEEKTEAKGAELDPEEVVETITFRGKEQQVRRKEVKNLLQKGRYSEVRMQELSPIIRLTHEAPEILPLLQTPEGRQQVIERIRMKEAKESTEEKIDDVDPQDLDLLRKVVQRELKQAGVQVAAKPTPEQTKAQQAEEALVLAKSRIVLESLQTLDPHYEENMVLLKETVKEAERTLPPEQFSQFYATINDPRILDPNTGRPAFLNFYADIDKERVRRAELSKPAAPNLPPVPRKTQDPGGRLAPGAAISPSSPPAGKDWFNLPSAEFDQAFNEALGRG